MPDYDSYLVPKLADLAMALKPYINTLISQYTKTLIRLLTKLSKQAVLKFTTREKKSDFTFLNLLLKVKPSAVKK